MRMIRTVLAAFAAVVLSLGLGASTLAPAGAADKPKRILEEKNPKDFQVDFNAFKLKGKVYQPLVDGTVEPYVEGVVKLQKKTCGTCKWKTVKKVKTNENGAYTTKIFTPRQGRWKWRVKVPASDGYATTKGATWTTLFDRN